MQFGVAGPDAFIDEFFLHESYRGRGWGRKTLMFAEEQARSLKITALHLEAVGKTRRH